MPEHSAPDTARTRLDKWLWAARLFKHRTAATEAVDGGKVKLNGASVKPAREVRAGDRVEVTIGDEVRSLTVRAIADKRGPASVARQLYEESADSIARREAARETRKLAATPGSDLHGRPTKRDRRHIRRFTGE